MNPRVFKGQQNKERRNGADQSTRPFAPVTAGAIQTRQERHLDGKQIAPDRSDVACLSLAEQNTLLRQKALYEVKQGHYDAAIALFSVLIERNPQSVNDYNNRGLLYVQNGQLAYALADYNAALQLNPRLAKIYNNRANCYASLGRPMEALFDYETALDLNPANTHARINQGITFRELEMYEHAIETFDLALQFDQLLSGASHTGKTTSIAGHIYAERGRTSHLAGDWNYAVADYRRTLAVLSPSETTLLDVSQRLRLQVKVWLSELLKPQPNAS
ncbi:MAG: tetratricopeptide repeat protein [Tildeniella nuda ZEHNDER 1965/U140]|jgi:tetratricopeptide (TPR) repeat protein|nr:tetratricopeptide repeat protein [Tildeniella nuda ZEHNDER 1965/U140]